MSAQKPGVKYLMGPGVEIMAYCDACGAKYAAKSGCWRQENNHLVHDCEMERGRVRDERSAECGVRSGE
jgi:hypothetical protein